MAGKVGPNSRILKNTKNSGEEKTRDSEHETRKLGDYKGNKQGRTHEEDTTMDKGRLRLCPNSEFASFEGPGL